MTRSNEGALSHWNALDWSTELLPLLWRLLPLQRPRIASSPQSFPIICRMSSQKGQVLAPGEVDQSVSSWVFLPFAWLELVPRDRVSALPAVSIEMRTNRLASQ